MHEHPEYQTQEDFQIRTTKLKEIRDCAVEPYPHKFTPTNTAVQLQQEYHQKEVGHSDDAGAGTTPFVRLAGRLILFRSMGKNAFAHLQDETGRIQLMFNRDLTQVSGFQGEKSELSPYKFIEKKLDLGDIIGVEGHLFYTQKGELTIFVKELTLLCKALLPLADKHGGLADKELRYRKRWLDLISHPEICQQFRTRSHIIQEIRAYFHAKEFLEVETPILQSIYGGAEARPFQTRLHALD